MGTEKGHARVVKEPIDVTDNQLPGLRVRDSRGRSESAVTVEEFGDLAYASRVTVARRDIPALVEALADQAREEDLDELQARVDDAVNWGAED